MKLGEALERFLTSCGAEGFSVETVVWYRRRLGRLVRFFPEMECEGVELDDLRRFVVSLYEQKEFHRGSAVVKGSLSIPTVHGYVRCVKRFFSWMEEEGYLDGNVAMRLRKPRLPKCAPKELAQSDLVKLLRASKSWGDYPERNYAMLLFLAETGVRVGGLVGLRARDIDIKKGEAVVTEKGNKSRVVFFGKKVRTALKAWLDDRPGKTDFVFIGKYGPLTCQGVRMVLRYLKEVAGIKGRVNPHSFRHFYAKRTMVRGGDIGVLADLMGHSDIKVTRDSYLVFRTGELRKVHMRFSSLDRILK